MFQSLKGFQRFCGYKKAHQSDEQDPVSIPKRVSEVLWQIALRVRMPLANWFQSLKGFQRFCGSFIGLLYGDCEVFQSLKGFQRFCGTYEDYLVYPLRIVSIPKRVSEVLWRRKHKQKWKHKNKFQSLKGFQRFCGTQTHIQSQLEPMFQSLKGFQRFCGSALQA